MEVVLSTYIAQLILISFKLNVFCILLLLGKGNFPIRHCKAITVKRFSNISRGKKTLQWIVRA